MSTIDGVGPPSMEQMINWADLPEEVRARIQERRQNGEGREGDATMGGVEGGRPAGPPPGPPPGEGSGPPDLESEAQALGIDVETLESIHEEIRAAVTQAMQSQEGTDGEDQQEAVRNAVAATLEKYGISEEDFPFPGGRPFHMVDEEA